MGFNPTMISAHHLFVLSNRKKNKRAKIALQEILR
jgi:hypothetical protein